MRTASIYWFEDGKELKLSENLTDQQKQKVTKFYSKMIRLLKRLSTIRRMCYQRA
jgi:hypothetical protein